MAADDNYQDIIVDGELNVEYFRSLANDYDNLGRWNGKMVRDRHFVAFASYFPNVLVLVRRPDIEFLRIILRLQSTDDLLPVAGAVHRETDLIASKIFDQLVIERSIVYSGTFRAVKEWHSDLTATLTHANSISHEYTDVETSVLKFTQYVQFVGRLLRLFEKLKNAQLMEAGDDPWTFRSQYEVDFAKSMKTNKQNVFTVCFELLKLVVDDMHVDGDHNELMGALDRLIEGSTWIKETGELMKSQAGGSRKRVREKIGNAFEEMSLEERQNILAYAEKAGDSEMAKLVRSSMSK